MKNARGYTLVELLMAVSAFAIGVTGLIALQKVTVVSNQHAKNLAVASHIAQSWVDTLTTDAQRWNAPSQTNRVPDLATDTLWLKEANSNPDIWVLPGLMAGYGPGFDALGNVVAAPAQASYCTHIRLSWLYNDTLPSPGNGLLRAEVRVFWLRDGANTINNWCAFGVTSTAAPDLVPNINALHFVQKVAAIRQNTL